MELVYGPVVAFTRTAFALMRWRVHVSGVEHLPAEGPAVIASNHVGYLDFAFLGRAALERGRLVRFMAKQEVFDHPVSGPLMRGMGHLPVDRFGGAVAAIDTAVAALRAGEVVGLFPEGTISRSFVPARPKTGAVRITMRAEAPLIPAAVWGSQRLLTKGRKPNWQRNVPILVVYGRPIDYDADDTPADVTDELIDRISALVDAAATSYPDQPAGDDDRWWLPAHLGGTAPSVDEAEAMADRERQERLTRWRAERAGGTGS
ncbi:MAG TPA: lysophospholipid acyltransferase family protein [Euzebyales bacterium]|nr:lysophospholipid acyltransferase family protein [Euzebyales bacterium]